LFFREVSMFKTQRHDAAVTRTLAWANEAAARNEYDDALRWLAVIDAIGDPLPAGYATKQVEWRLAERVE
jgi:hypothetical protein